MLLIRGDRNLCLVKERVFESKSFATKFPWPECALRCDAYTVEFFRIFEHMQFRNRLQGDVIFVHVLLEIQEIHSMHSIVSFRIFLLWLRRSYECCTIHISGRRMKPIHISPVTCQVAWLPRLWCAAVAKQSGTQSTGRIWRQKSRFKWRKFEKLHLYNIIYVRNSAFRLRNERWRKKVWPLALLEHETMHFRMNFFEMSQIASMSFDSFACCTSIYYMHFISFHVFCLGQVLLSVVAVSGPNTGRKFRCCANPVNQQCGYFAMSLLHDVFMLSNLPLTSLDCLIMVILCSWILGLATWVGRLAMRPGWMIQSQPNHRSLDHCDNITQCQRIGFTWTYNNLHVFRFINNAWSSSSQRHVGRRFYHGPETPLNKALKGWSVFCWPLDLACLSVWCMVNAKFLTMPSPGSLEFKPKAMSLHQFLAAGYSVRWQLHIWQKWVGMKHDNLIWFIYKSYLQDFIRVSGCVRPLADAKEEVHQSVFRACHTARTRLPLPHSLYMASGGVLLLCRVVTACRLRDFRRLNFVTRKQWKGRLWAYEGLWFSTAPRLEAVLDACGVSEEPFQDLEAEIPSRRFQTPRTSV